MALSVRTQNPEWPLPSLQGLATTGLPDADAVLTPMSTLSMLSKPMRTSVVSDKFKLALDGSACHSPFVSLAL